tara:strand:+ start:360 stop:1004 length:645 start_codon:yes stop_codon:yes gene_type:complete
MKKNEELPNIIPIFPLSNFIIFPKTTVPLNIFEPRYIQMINDSMKSHRMIGMIQPKKTGEFNSPELYGIGCVGKITSFNETDDGRYLIVLNGVSRFKILEEFKSDKLYRKCKVSFELFSKDLNKIAEEVKFSDLELIFKNFKTFFQKQGYLINWKDLEKQSLDQIINTLSMASPFSLEEKQALLETIDLETRKKKLEEILEIYIFDNFSNTTIQ